MKWTLISQLKRDLLQLIHFLIFLCFTILTLIIQNLIPEYIQGFFSGVAMKQLSICKMHVLFLCVFWHCLDVGDLTVSEWCVINCLMCDNMTTSFLNYYLLESTNHPLSHHIHYTNAFQCRITSVHLPDSLDWQSTWPWMVRVCAILEYKNIKMFICLSECYSLGYVCNVNVNLSVPSYI